MIGSPTEPSRRSERARRLLHRLLAAPHQRADRGGRGVEDVDLVLVDDLPEAGHRRIVRHALEHQRRRAVGERAVDDVAVAGHPADVGGAPVDVAVVVVEDVLVGHRGVDEIAAGGVQHALGLAGRARGVEDEQRVLGVHRLAAGSRPSRLAPPRRSQTSRPASMATAPPVRRTTSTVSTPPAFVERRVDVGLERHLAAAAQALVGGDDDAWSRQSSMRLASASGEKPPNTTEWMAPMRAQASMA